MFRLPRKIITPPGAVASISSGNTLFLPFFALTLCLVQPCAASPGEWEYTGSLGTARGSHTATLLPDGKVLVAGGHDHSSSFLSSAELYDPATGTWSNTGSLVTARDGHTATLLSSGKVLVTAGFGSGVALSSAELSGDRPRGTLSYSDLGAAISISKARVRSLTITGNSADFSGMADLGGGNRVTCDVSITDNGDGSSDTFSITLSNGYSAGGTLTKGDIQIF